MTLHAQWLNSTLRQMWPYYDAAVCATVKARVLPGPCPSLCWSYAGSLIHWSLPIIVSVSWFCVQFPG